jgi:hypothetical protein
LDPKENILPIFKISALWKKDKVKKYFAWFMKQVAIIITCFKNDFVEISKGHPKENKGLISSVFTIAKESVVITCV